MKKIITMLVAFVFLFSTFASNVQALLDAPEYELNYDFELTEVENTVIADNGVNFDIITSKPFASITASAKVVVPTPNTSWFTVNPNATIFEIMTADELAGFAQLVNEGIGFNGATIILKDDIDLSSYGEHSQWNNGRGWIPIGDNLEWVNREWRGAFGGIFDGGGHVITGLYINDTNLRYTGLFGITHLAVVKNIRIEDAYVRGSSAVGGAIGQIFGGSVENIGVSGEISGVFNVGGVVGIISGEISRSSSSATVRGIGGSGFDIGNLGGVVGNIGGNSNVSHVFSTGDIVGTARCRQVGGIAGRVFSSGRPDAGIENSWSTGTVSGGAILGGIAGNVPNGVIRNSVALNPIINGGWQLVGRVNGDTPPRVFENNAAFNGMVLIVEREYFYNGSELFSNDIIADGTLGGRFTAENGWTIENGRLPGLFGETIEIPEHLLVQAPPGIGWFWSNPNAAEFTISTASELAELAALVNRGVTFAGKTIHLANSIDISMYGAGRNFNYGRGWMPIGIRPYSFHGTFDGNGYVITGFSIDLSISRPLNGYSGLFGSVVYGAVRNLKLADIDINTFGNNGVGLADVLYNSVVENVAVTGRIRGGFNYGGGIAGSAISSQIINCYSGVDIIVSGVGVFNLAGGIVGAIEGWYPNLSIVRNSYSTGAISGLGVGGIVGQTHRPFAVVENNVALNSSVISLSSFLSNATIAAGRVVGRHWNESVFRHNFGLSDMQVTLRGADKYPLNIGRDKDDGANVSIEEALTAAFWIDTMGWCFDVWIIEDGYLPRLRNLADVPERVIPYELIPLVPTQTPTRPDGWMDLGRFANLANFGWRHICDRCREAFPKVIRTYEEFLAFIGTNEHEYWANYGIDVPEYDETFFETQFLVYAFDWSWNNPRFTAIYSIANNPGTVNIEISRRRPGMGQGGVAGGTLVPFVLELDRSLVDNKFTVTFPVRYGTAVRPKYPISTFTSTAANWDDNAPSLVRINSAEELRYYYEQHRDFIPQKMIDEVFNNSSFDESFFRNRQSLMLLRVAETSGSNILELTSICSPAFEGAIDFDIMRTVQEVGTDDMHYWYFVFIASTIFIQNREFALVIRNEAENCDQPPQLCGDCDDEDCDGDCDDQGGNNGNQNGNNNNQNNNQGQNNNNQGNNNQNQGNQQRRPAIVASSTPSSNNVTTPAAQSFIDVSSSDWFYNYVRVAVASGLLNAVGNGEFAPNMPTTRAMFVTVLWRLAGEPNGYSNNSFSDVNGDWYSQAVAWASANGLVNGIGNGYFAPNVNITREQMGLILERFVGDLVDMVMDREYVPQNTVTRAEMAAVMLRLGNEWILNI